MRMLEGIETAEASYYFTGRAMCCLMLLLPERVWNVMPQDNIIIMSAR